jgi:large repetitive protein
MKYTMPLAMGIFAIMQWACSSSDGSKNESTVGGSSNAAGNNSTIVEGGASNSTTSANGGTTSTKPVSQSDVELAVNEVVPSNKTGAIDEGGAYPDWVELYNYGSKDVSLEGFYLSDSPDEPTKAAFDASLKIPAGGVLVLWADGDTDQGAAHLPFSLAASSEGIYLYDSSKQLVDSVEWTNANPDTSYSRFPDGTGSFSWCAKPTPNKTNGSACSN